LTFDRTCDTKILIQVISRISGTSRILMVVVVLVLFC